MATRVLERATYEDLARLPDMPELHLGSNVLVPDLAGYRGERMPQIPTGQSSLGSY